jgi:protein-S-isoprenylcysteine O-methyltransferase Ste14
MLSAKHSKPRIPGLPKRRFSDFLLFGVTATELAILVLMTRTFTMTDWIYLSQHLIVLAIAVTRAAPYARDGSLATGIAVVVSYGYPYAQIIYLRLAPGELAWPEGGFVLVTLAACLSAASLITLGRRFGVRPALRSLTTKGPYALVRHPMYLSYVVADIGYNLQEWNAGTALMVVAGWASLIYRIRAEERILSLDAGWQTYAGRVRYRLLPGIW